MSTKTELVKAKLAKNPNPNPEEVREWAKEIGCSPSLVYKWLRKIPEAERRVVKAGEPVIKVEEEAEVIEEAPAETFEVPSEFAEEKPAEAIEKPEEEIVVEEEAEEERILRDISKRAIKRFFGVAIEEGLGLAKDLGLTDQEAEDTEVVTMLLLAKYLMVEIKENLLEITSGLHFGSIGLKLLVAWIKKKRAEGKKKEEERKEQPKVTPAEKPEEKPTELQTPVEVEAQENQEERGADGLTKTERQLKKKWLGGI